MQLTLTLKDICSTDVECEHVQKVTSDLPVGLRHAGVRRAVQALLQLLILETTTCLFEGKQTHYAKIKQTRVDVPLNHLFLDNLCIFSRLSLIL